MLCWEATHILIQCLWYISYIPFIYLYLPIFLHPGMIPISEPCIYQDNYNRLPFGHNWIIPVLQGWHGRIWEFKAWMIDSQTFDLQPNKLALCIPEDFWEEDHLDGLLNLPRHWYHLWDNALHEVPLLLERLIHSSVLYLQMAAHHPWQWFQCVWSSWDTLLQPIILCHRLHD